MRAHPLPEARLYGDLMLMSLATHRWIVASRDPDFILTSDGIQDAIDAANDDYAFGVVSALEERGIRTPEDIAVVGYDNHTNVRTHDLGYVTTTGDGQRARVHRKVNINAATPGTRSRRRNQGESEIPAGATGMIPASATSSRSEMPPPRAPYMPTAWTSSM